MVRRVRRSPAVRTALTVAVALAVLAPLAADAGRSARAAHAQTTATGEAMDRVTAVAPRAMPAQPFVTAAAADPPVTSPVVTAVTRRSGTLDVFGVDAGQRIYTAAWVPGSSGWERSAQLAGGLAAKGTSVYGVSRYTGRMDVFAVGTDRRVWTAFRDDPLAVWQGWWTIGSLKVAPNTSVHAVTSHRDRMDLFAVGEDLKAYHITWQASTGWSASWTKLDGVRVSAGTMVFGVSGGRFTNSLDIFAVQVGGGVFFATPYHNSYTPDGGWTGWKEIRDAPMLSANASVVPVSRSWGKIDVFVSGYSGGVYQHTWSSVEGWTGPYDRGGSATGTVSATTRLRDTIDVVATRSDGVYASSMTWDRRWSAWTKIGGAVARGTTAFVHSRMQDQLDVFTVSPNTGTYTAGWSPSGGWAGWWEVGPMGQAGQSLEVRTTFSLGGGVTVDGWAHLRVASGGAWVFEGNFHNYGPTNYEIRFAWMIVLPSGKSFCFAEKGKVSGWASSNGSADHSWYAAGASNDIKQNWAEIESNGIWQWKASGSVDVVDLVSQIGTGLGIIGTLIVIFG